MAVRVYQRAFNGGEVAPSMYARIDDGKYQTGLAKCTNFLVEPQGPITIRPGFAYVNKTKQQDKPARLIPFTFSTDQTMVLEFGNKYVRFHTQGKTLMGSNNQPYEVSTPYSIDDVFDLHYVQSADVLTLVHPKYAPRELKRYGATDWRLEQINFASSLAAPTNVNVSQHINSEVTNKEDYVREYAVTALLADGSQESARSTSKAINCNPYGDGAYNTITWDAVSGAGLYRVYRNEGGVWAFIGQTNGTSIRDENIDPDASITPPIYDMVFNQAGGITSVQVTNQGSGYTGDRGISSFPGILYTDCRSDGNVVYFDYDSDMVIKIDPETGELIDPWHFIDLFIPYYYPAPLGGSTALFDYIYAKVFDLEGNGSGAVVKFDWYYSDWNVYIKSFTILNKGSNYVKPRVYIIDRRNNCPCAYIDLPVEADAGQISLVVNDPTGSGAVLEPVVSGGKITAVNVINGGQNYTNPTITVVSKNGSGATFKVNVGQAGDYPGAVTYFEQRRWFGGTLTRPNNLWATKSGTESDMSYSLPSQDDDRIAVRVAAREANRIQHMVPLAQLMLLTAAAEWRVSPLNSDAITPSSMSVRPQSYVGANNVQPLVVSSTMIYAAERGGHLRECGYSYEAGGYISNDVCLRAPHLFDNYNIVDMAYAKAPWPIAWIVNDQGDLISMTYVPEQQVGAFSKIETNNGRFRSCCVVAEGDEDILYCVIERIIAGVNSFYIERMTERQYSVLDKCNFLDSSGTYVGEPKEEITGLTWLEGMQVSIVADGGIEEPQVVTDGKIKLQMPASIVHVGLAYNADVQTLPVALALQDGSYGSGHQKNVRSVSLRVIDSSGIKAGPSFADLREYPARSTESADSPPDPITDEIDLPITGKWNKSGTVCIRQSNPLPIKIVSITTTVEIS